MQPCSACATRGIDCDWVDCAPLLVRRDGNDAAELRAQIDRLQHIVESLASQASSGSQPHAGLSQSRPSQSRNRLSSAGDTPATSDPVTPPDHVELETVRRAPLRIAHEHRTYELTTLPSTSLKSPFRTSADRTRGPWRATSWSRRLGDRVWPASASCSGRPRSSACPCPIWHRPTASV